MVLSQLFAADVEVLARKPVAWRAGLRLAGRTALNGGVGVLIALVVMAIASVACAATAFSEHAVWMARASQILIMRAKDWVSDGLLRLVIRSGYFLIRVAF